MGKQNNPENVPRVVKEPTYPILPHPFHIKPIVKEVFYGIKTVVYEADRATINKSAGTALKKSHTLRMKYIVYVLKLGFLIEVSLRELESTGKCDVSMLKKYIHFEKSIYGETDKDGRYMGIHNHLHEALDVLRMSLQHFVSTAEMSCVASVSEQMRWGVKTPIQV